MTVHRTRLHRPAAQHPNSIQGARPAKVLSGPRRMLARLGARLQEERGDVPGWVLITIMTAAIVIGLWAVASDQLIQIFNNAMAPFLNPEF